MGKVSVCRRKCSVEERGGSSEQWVPRVQVVWVLRCEGIPRAGISWGRGSQEGDEERDETPEVHRRRGRDALETGALAVVVPTPP